MNFLEALRENALLQTSLLAIVGASIASGIIGTYVVAKRVASLSGSIAHSILSGLGCALWLKRNFGYDWSAPIYGALIAAILSASLIGWVHLHYREREDSVIAMIWSVGMAIGVIFISQTPGFNVELMNFLLGNVLWVSMTDLLTLGILDCIIFGIVLCFHQYFLALCFDEKQAQLQGVPVKSLYLLLLILIALSIVILIHIVGIILLLVMLVLPASIASHFSHRLSMMMGIAVILNFSFSLGGLAIAYRLDWPVGAAIALFACGGYLLSLRFKKSRRAVTP